MIGHNVKVGWDFTLFGMRNQPYIFQSVRFIFQYYLLIKVYEEWFVVHVVLLKNNTVKPIYVNNFMLVWYS